MGEEIVRMIIQEPSQMYGIVLIVIMLVLCLLGGKRRAECERRP